MKLVYNELTMIIDIIIMSLLPSVLMRMCSTSNKANSNKQVIFFSDLGTIYGDVWIFGTMVQMILSYEPLHGQMQRTWLAVPDTDSHMTCSTSMAFL